MHSGAPYGRAAVWVIWWGGGWCDTSTTLRLSEECGTVAIDGAAVNEKAGGVDATAEMSALRLRKELLQQETNLVFVVHNYPATISQALLTEIQVTPASVCVYLDVPVDKQAEICSVTVDSVEAEMRKTVHPILEYHRAKETLHTIDASKDDWRQSLVEFVGVQKEVLARDTQD